MWPLTVAELANQDPQYYLGRLPLPDAFSSNGNILIRRITGDGLDLFEVGTVDWSDSVINPGN